LSDLLEWHIALMVLHTRASAFADGSLHGAVGVAFAGAMGVYVWTDNSHGLPLVALVIGFDAVAFLHVLACPYKLDASGIVAGTACTHH
jgi:hypothetical protein